MSPRNRKWNGRLITGCIAGIIWIAWTGIAMAQAVLPQEADWIDYGLALDTGPHGTAFDCVMEGLTPCSIVEKDGTFYLYYVGADDYISQKNNIGPAHRSIGVAISTDCITWTKYSGNPIITWSVAGNPEEGAPSCGVYLDSNGEFVAYYGANTSGSPTSPSVSADSRLAVSANGLDFTDRGIVASHSDTSIWGYGDELHAKLAWFSNGTWYCYYRPNGTEQSGKLGYVSGPTRANLTSSGPVLSSGAQVANIGGASIVPLDGDEVAFFISQGKYKSEVRTTTINDLTNLSSPIRTYSRGRALLHLDRNRNTWFMYYDNWTHISIRIAPNGAPDTTPPTSPPGLTATVSGHGAINLSWSPASDSDTGILRYSVYRDAVSVGTTYGLTFTDTGLSELTPYSYEVKAVNLHGTEGPSAFVSATTNPDITPPNIAAVNAGGDPALITVVFDEPVEQASAETPGNYTVSNGVTVIAAVLDADLKTVTLTTTNQAVDALYTLTVSNVLDRAATPNVSRAQSEYTFANTAGLIGYWRCDATAGTMAKDTSGSLNHGTVYGSPAWTAGHFSNALDLDGVDDFVEMKDTASLDTAATGSFTLAAWVRAADVPPDTTASNGNYTVFKGPNMYIAYTMNQTFLAQTRTSGGAVNLTSGVFAPGAFHHLAMVVDGAAKQLHFFVDGVPVAGSPKSYTGNLSALPDEVSLNWDRYQSVYRIGVSNPNFDNQSNYFKGLIDDVRAYEGALTSSEVQELANPVGNNAPSVDAGADQSITLPADTVNLDGTVTDDGLPFPPGAVTVAWSKVSGPDTVTFGDVNAVDTPAQFGAAGVYVLQLLADDSILQSSNTVQITVDADANTINAPANLVASKSGNTVTLTWNDSSGNEIGFNIERGIKSGKGKNAVWTYAVVGTVEANVTTYQDTPSNGTYRYRVQAFIDAEIVSGYSNTVRVRVR